MFWIAVRDERMQIQSSPRFRSIKTQLASSSCIYYNTVSSTSAKGILLVLSFIGFRLAVYFKFIIDAVCRGYKFGSKHPNFLLVAVPQARLAVCRGYNDEKEVCKIHFPINAFLFVDRYLFHR